MPGVVYTTRRGQEHLKDDITDALPTAEDERSGRCESIKLQDDLGRMYKHRREAIIHFLQFNQEKEPSKVYKSKIMPWRDESYWVDTWISAVILKTRLMIFRRMSKVYSEC